MCATNTLHYCSPLCPSSCIIEPSFLHFGNMMIRGVEFLYVIDRTKIEILSLVEENCRRLRLSQIG